MDNPGPAALRAVDNNREQAGKGRAVSEERAEGGTLDMFQKAMVSLFTVAVVAAFTFGFSVKEQIAILSEQDRQVPSMITEASLRHSSRRAR